MLGIIEPPDVALSWSLRSIELAEQTTDAAARGWLGPLYNNTGWTLHDLGRFEEALQMFVKGLAFRREQGQPVETCIAKWCVARCLRSLGRVDEALVMQRELIDDWKEAGQEERGYVSEEIANCLWELGRHNDSREWFARAHERLSVNEAWLLTEQPERMARLKQLAEGGAE
jgi:tetratricopeptide (TPR) repeat protein